MNFWKKAVSAGLASALVFLAGCSGSAPAWVYKYGDQQPPIGIYLIYLISAASSADSLNSAANADVSGYEYPDYKELLKLTVEDQPADQWIEADALRKMKEYFAVEERFAAMGLTLTDADHASVRAAAANTWQTYGEFYEGNGVSQSSMELQMANSLKKERLFEAIYGEGGEKAVPEADIKAAFAADYAQAELMVFSKASSNPANEAGGALDAEAQIAADAAEGILAETQNDTAKARAESYLKRLTEGEALEDLVFEQETEEMAGSETQPTKPEPGERSVILTRDATGTSYYSAELVEGAMAATVGTPVLVEDANYYYVLRRQDILADATVFETYRAQVLKTMKTEEYEEMVKQWGEAITPEANNSALSKYKPSRLKIDS